LRSFLDRCGSQARRILPQNATEFVQWSTLIFQRTNPLAGLTFLSLLAVLALGLAHNAEAADASETIDARVVERFSLTLKANPSPGYRRWLAYIDHAYLRLEFCRFEGPRRPPPGGYLGTQIYTLIPLKEGVTQIKLQSNMPWEPFFWETKRYVVTIKAEK